MKNHLKIALLEKKIADLEKQVQSQQKSINLLLQQYRDHPLELSEQAVRDALAIPHNLAFRVNLNNRVLFEQKPEQNS